MVDEDMTKLFSAVALKGVNTAAMQSKNVRIST